MISFSADNADMNYGVNKSVFTNLRAKQKHIVKGNCNCHVLHNCVKFSLKNISFDLEKFIYKLYKYFKTSEVHTEILKIF